MRRTNMHLRGSDLDRYNLMRIMILILLHPQDCTRLIRF